MSRINVESVFWIGESTKKKNFFAKLRLDRLLKNPDAPQDRPRL
jgi:hypothetical protein